MDTENKDNELNNPVDEQKTENQQTPEQGSSQEAPQDSASNQDSAKAFWKETPFDEMQHVKPDSFAGLEGGTPNNSSNNGSSDGRKSDNRKQDSDAYWRPRSASQNKGDGKSSGNSNNYYRGPEHNPGNGSNGNGPLHSRKNRIGLYIFIGLIILFAITIFTSNNGVSEVTYTSFKGAVETGKVSKVNIKNNTYIYFSTMSGSEYRTRIPYSDAKLLDLLESHNVEISGSDQDISILAIIFELLPWVIFIGFTIMLLRQTSGNGQMMQFGKSHAKQFSEKEIKVKFKDVAGQKEAKYELEEVVDFLKNPKKYSEIGAKIPKGVLLVGPPGTGKTLIAKAVAGEAGVSFFHTSGSDFVEMFVGMGAARVRDLFDQGRKHSPCILFIDEIDAVGRARGSGLGGGHDEREQTLNQILVEMDGFDTSTGVIVIAATNRADVLDPALLRPGRFDRQVAISLPDIQEREDILKIHAAKVKTGEDVDLKKIARATPGASGADLANLVNEAALFATRQNRKVVCLKDFEQARDKMVLGVAKKSHVMTPEDKLLTAYHEGGHALLFYYLSDIDPLYKVTIIPHGNAGGVTMGLPEKDQSYMKRSSLMSHIKMAMGGYIAEKLLNGQTSTGPSSDIKQATDIARRMVTEWGMSNLGFISLGSEGEPLFLGREIAQHKDFSDETARKIDAEVQGILKECMDDATRILTEHRDQLDLLARELVAKETLDDNEVRELLGFEAYGPKNSDIK
ncbi:MAG: ATP-dependent zinc metalloprotease FtsH [Sphaerochaetaceae bacterium]|nr:ATP-dependent zinc metalloprotease FtsH [Sphaerochaetaceae bacterium]